VAHAQFETIHPLIDGNKRTAWTLMVLMLWINGYRHDFSTDEGFDLVVDMAAGKLEKLISWSRTSVEAYMGVSTPVAAHSMSRAMARAL